jgi:uncharacterized protein (DUF58 family)
MSEPRKSFLDAQKLTKVARMELVARQVVEGFVSGRHPSPYHGSSVEYADHRPYTVNDEIRTLDWKLLAKTDKYYVKLFEEETNLRCTILLDTSKSMSYQSEKAAFSKVDYGAYLSLALGYLMLGQNDAVGLVLFDSTVREYLPPRTTASHFRRMAELMQHTTPRSDTRLGPVLHEMAGRIKRRGMVIVISDLIDDLDAVIDGLSHFRFDKHEVIVFHVMDPAELSFPYERLTRFKDIEGVGSIVANPRSVRARYLERLGKFLADVKQRCLERGISYQFCQTDTPYDKMLLAYLGQRMRAK